ncbi:gamma-glutamyltransferase family protein [Ramlibacter sp. MAHUQ-53]|uniref:gamma-glutamyltransferase family protein n=1 Tax=unclassified Ramlibacter TaxID=2617605 RepID=UPI00364345DE
MKARLSALLAAALLAACTLPSPVPPVEASAPEAPSALVAKAGWTLRTHAVAAAHPLAAEAGDRLLRAGGSALDAAIAAQMVLALVEPQSSGIGGGAFLMHWDGRTVEAYDGRETAPAAADERLFLDPEGRPLAFPDAVVGGRAVGVPGAVRMLEMAHRAHGRLPWARLFEPAIALAEGGFPVGERLNTLLRGDPHLRRDPAAAAYFYDGGGAPLATGALLRNPALAGVFRRLAAEGSKALHEGEIAQAIVDKVRGHPTNPGRLTRADLAGYTPRQREPLCHDHAAGGREWRICGFPPPGSGAIAIGQVLGLLARTGAGTQPPQDGLPSADWLHLYTEAARLAFADRAQYVADPDFVAPPAGDWRSLLAPAYLDARARLVGPRSLREAPPGRPGGVPTAFAPMHDQPERGTTHLSVVDAQGRAVALTSTIEDQFGARQMVRGFLLNNELTDFSFLPADAQGRPVANRVEPGKRPRSSMSPTLVFDKASGQLAATLGSPGGAMIIHYTAKALVGTLDWGLDPQRAIDLPNFGSVGGPTLLEAGRFPAATVQALRARGAEVREVPLTSGLHALSRTPAGWSGGADPRREGVVRGD